MGTAYSSQPANFDVYGRPQESNIVTQGSQLETIPKMPAREHGLHFWIYSAFFMRVEKNMSDTTFKCILGPGLHRYGIEDSRENPQQREGKGRERSIEIEIKIKH